LRVAVSAAGQAGEAIPQHHLRLAEAIQHRDRDLESIVAAFLHRRLRRFEGCFRR